MVDDQHHDDERQWSFKISLDLRDNFAEENHIHGPTARQPAQTDDDEIIIPASVAQSFQRDGFIVVKDPVLSREDCDALNQQLEEILRGRYSAGRAPDKAPRRLKSEYQGSPHAAQLGIQQPPQQGYSRSSKSKESDPQDEREQTTQKPSHLHSLIGPIGFSGNFNNVKVIQVINVHKANRLYRQLACSPVLGQIVAQLAGWTMGARLAQDQVWAKPPAAAPLAFHRDSPYFMFAPDDVVTVWLALDDMDEELGPLQYVKGSHLWGDGRVGVASQFFQSDGGVALLKSAAKRAQVPQQASLEDLEIVSLKGLPAGALSIHKGRTWHGRGKNNSKIRPRRGLGLHFVPANVRFTADAYHSRLWRLYVENVLADGGDPSTVELPLRDFPIVWQPSSTFAADDVGAAED